MGWVPALLKIRVSVVQFHPWPPFQSVSCLKSARLHRVRSVAPDINLRAQIILQEEHRAVHRKAAFWICSVFVNLSAVSYTDGYSRRCEFQYRGAAGESDLETA